MSDCYEQPTNFIKNPKKYKLADWEFVVDSLEEACRTGGVANVIDIYRNLDRILKFFIAPNVVEMIRETGDRTALHMFYQHCCQEFPGHIDQKCWGITDQLRKDGFVIEYVHNNPTTIHDLRS